MKYQSTVCNKKNCPIQYDKVREDCNIIDCPYRTVDTIEDWQIAIQFLNMIFKAMSKKEGENK